MKVFEGITVNPAIMGGLPCVEGHRFPTKILRDYARGGYEYTQIKAEYSWITHEHIANALLWEFMPAAWRKQRVDTALEMYALDETP